MSEEIEITLPKLGESIVRATIVQWFKEEGDLIELDQPLVEVSTDKVNSEIPSPVAGKITRVLVQKGEELDVGEPLARIIAIQRPDEKVCPTASPSLPKRVKFTPVIKKIAKERGLSLSELEQIPATGVGGRLSKRDLENYLKKKSKNLGDTYTPISPMRKIIADNMVRSLHEVPHVTLVSEVDLSKIVQLISTKKSSFKNAYGYNLTITPFIADAIGKTIGDFPLVNSSFEANTIVTKSSVNLGIAVNVEEGVLVPILLNCQTLLLTEIAIEIAKLSDRARSGKLDLDQLQGGTITMTNFGMSGALLGTPIIRYGEVAIVGVGAVKKRVVVLEDDTMAIRSIIYITLTFDHRVFDGMYGCRYLAAMKYHLESDFEQL